MAQDINGKGISEKGEGKQKIGKEEEKMKAKLKEDENEVENEMKRG